MLFEVFFQVPFHDCPHSMTGLRAHLQAWLVPAQHLCTINIISFIVFGPLNNIPAMQHLENT